jgi:lipopolysaccharide transport system permease protein/teichoic acid transport system permease protein
MLHNIKAFLYFLKTIYQQRYVINKLVIRDFQKKYLGSYLGLPWAFLQPIAIVLVLWLVISVGLRGGMAGDDVEFLPWLLAAMIPWFFIQETLNTSSGSLLSYSFLIKQMYFRVGVIPLITIITALIIHLFLVLILMIIVVIYGYYPSIHWIQFLYYLIGTLVLLTGIGWLNSAIMVFVRDLQQTISIFITLFFWLTPIIWPHQRLTGKARLLVDLNPFFYITNGYRETFITHEWFFENVWLTLYFWVFVTFIFISGALVFHKLKPHFADVL